MQDFVTCYKCLAGKAKLPSTKLQNVGLWFVFLLVLLVFSCSDSDSVDISQERGCDLLLFTTHAAAVAGVENKFLLLCSLGLLWEEFYFEHKFNFSGRIRHFIS